MGNNSWWNWFGNKDGMGDNPGDGDGYSDVPSISFNDFDELVELVRDLDTLKAKFFRDGRFNPVAEGIYGSDKEERRKLTEDELIDAIEFKIPTVRVKTEFFEAEAIEMYEMPYGQVLDLITAGGPRQMFKMLDMFRLAVIDQTLLDDMELLTFNEISEVIGQWAAKSTVRWMSINVSGDGDGDGDVQTDS